MVAKKCYRFRFRVIDNDGGKNRVSDDDDNEDENGDCNDDEDYEWG